MSQKYLIRIAELESQLRQKDQQLSLVEETEAFLRSALALHPAMEQQRIRPCHGEAYHRVRVADVLPQPSHGTRYYAAVPRSGA